MNWFFTEEQQMIIDTAREVAQKKILPVREKYDHEGIFPWDVVKAMADVDIFGVYIPEEYGGLGYGIFEMCLAVEELSKVCGGISLAFAACALGTFPILLFGTEEQKKKYLPDIAAGKKLAAFGLTEANAGSDALAMKTTAKLEGDYYILNGTKQWISNGENAEIYSVIVKTNPKKGARGLSAFIIEKGTEGFSFGKHEDKMGIRASSTTELIFQDCKIPKENLLSREGMGAIVAINTFNISRLRALLKTLSNIPVNGHNSGSPYPLSRQFSICLPIWQPRLKLHVLYSMLQHAPLMLVRRSFSKKQR